MEAKKIIDKLGVYSEDTDIIVGTISIPQLSVAYSHVIEKTTDEGLSDRKMPTEKQTRENAVKVLQKHLDDGDIVLSDTWLEDQHQDVKDLTEENEKAEA